MVVLRRLGDGTSLVHDECADSERVEEGPQSTRVAAVLAAAADTPHPVDDAGQVSGPSLQRTGRTVPHTQNQRVGRGGWLFKCLHAKMADCGTV